MAVLLLGLLGTACQTTQKQAAEAEIIPKPVSLQQQAGSFTLTPQTALVVLADSLQNSAAFFNKYLEHYYGFTLEVKQGTPADTAAENAIVLGVAPMDKATAGGYTLHSDDAGIQISGKDAPGVFYGIQTLIQLLPTTPSESLAIAKVNITDYPEYGYRGMMLDCARHFFDTAFIKEFIDFIALHKMNIFHWHLTGDQGWRIEIKKYPKLTEVGAWRDSTVIGHNRDEPQKFDTHRYGGFYTQDEIRDIVQYAKERYITIIPEIEMPGHSMAAIAAYPELACDDNLDYHVATTWGVKDIILCPTPYTFNFYKNVLTEVMALFPSHYIHIGGDEVPKKMWENSAFCQRLMKEKGLKNEEELQSYFIHTMEQFLNANGRDIIGWDEILEGGLAPNATVMSWRGEKGGIKAANMKHEVIMTPTTYCYFDYYQSKNHDSIGIGGYLPIDTVYSYNPVGPLSSEAAGYIKGVQANVWTEYIQWPTHVEYMIFPRMEAISEVAWTAPEKKDFADFSKRMLSAYKRYDLWQVSYSKDFLERLQQPGDSTDKKAVDSAK